MRPEPVVAPMSSPVLQRRAFLTTAVATVTTILAATRPALAKPAAPTANISPEQAYGRLLVAREELKRIASDYISKRDTAGLRALLLNPNADLNRMDTSIQILLESKTALDAESKKAIGTIRTYGVGADVMIMYGGLRSEFISTLDALDAYADSSNDDLEDLDDDSSRPEPNWGNVQKYLVKTLDSLQEVIVICRSNGLEKKWQQQQQQQS